MTKILTIQKWWPNLLAPKWPKTCRLAVKRLLQKDAISRFIIFSHFFTFLVPFLSVRIVEK
jgi:hypothetical protein